MHMANELLSVPVAVGGFALSGVWLAAVCHKVKNGAVGSNAALMGIMGAFIFAAQMVNFKLPIMPGTSGHLVGAVLLSIILGPHLAMITLSSVVIIQCLIFQDGGILALGCNILNMVIVPVYIGHFIYKNMTAGNSSRGRLYLASIIASVTALEAGAILVPFEVELSGVLSIPVLSFLATMAGVHLLVGIMEGLITAAVLVYIMSVRPQVIGFSGNGSSLSPKSFATVIMIITVVVAGGVSLIASDKPDGLEWSYAERPDQKDFKPIIENDDIVIAKADVFQAKYSFLPDYAARTAVVGNVNEISDESHGWRSFAGVCGALITMALIGAVSWFLRRKAAAVR